MASESLSFDILARDKASGSFRDAGRSAADLAGKMDLAARNARVLDESLQKQRKTTDVLAGATLATAKADKILADAEHVLADGALEAEFALKKETEAARKSGDAAVRAAAENRTLGESLKKVGDSSFFKPSGLGIAAALSPALIPLAGSIAGAAGAIGVSFGAAAIGVGAFGLLAKLALTQAGTAASAVSKAQNAYNAAIASGTKRAVAYKAEQKAIALAYAQMSPQQIALSKQVGDLQNAWQGVQKSLTPVIGGALLPWLNAATIAMKLIKPFVTPVAAVFRDWGTSLDKYFKNPAAFSNIQKAAAAFGKFSASQLRDVGRFIGDIAQGVFNLGKDFASGGASFGAAGTWLAGIGAGFLSWSKSSKARGEVQGFLHYLHTEGPVVKGILSDLGTIIPGIFKGATTTGTLELQAIGELLSLVSKLPKGWQAPLTEAAGAILLLSKTGVVKVGFTVAGTAAGWVKKLLGGATVDLGAAGMQKAGDTMVGAAAAMQRAADTLVGGAGAGGAGAKAAGAGVAGGAAGGGAVKGALSGVLSAAGPLIAGVVAGGVIKGFGDALSPANSVWGRLNKTLQSHFDIPGFNIFSGFIAKSLPALAGFISTARKDWADLLGWLGDRTASGVHVVEGSVDNLRHNIASTFDGIRHNIAAEWDTIWNNAVGRVRSGIADVVGWFKGLPGRAVSALTGLGHSLAAFASAAISQMWTGFRNTFAPVITWFEGLPRRILSALGIHSPPGWAIDAGKHIMAGLNIGLGHGLGKLQNFTSGIGAQVAAGLSGGFGVPGNVKSYTPEILRSLRMLGQPASDLGVVLSQMTTESGGNPTIVNKSDSNWFAGHPSVGLMQVIRGTFDAYAGPYRNTGPFEYGVSTNPMANIYAGLNYAVSRYGAGWPLVLGHGHGYASGTSSAAPGWALVGERGAELVKFRGGEQVQPIRSGGRGGGALKVVLEVRTGNGATALDRAIVDIVKHYARVSGGGDVQAAYGSG